MVICVASYQGLQIFAGRFGGKCLDQCKHCRLWTNPGGSKDPYCVLSSPQGNALSVWMDPLKRFLWVSVGEKIRISPQWFPFSTNLRGTVGSTDLTETPNTCLRSATHLLGHFGKSLALSGLWFSQFEKKMMVSKILFCDPICRLSTSWVQSLDQARSGRRKEK